MKYFAYGSNIPKIDMGYRCPGATPISSWTLPNHKLCFHDVANVIPCDGNDVVGALWDITPQDEVNLDRYEGYPMLYDKHWHNGVLYYRMNFDFEEDNMLYLPMDFYLAGMMRGYDDFGIDRTNLLRSMGFPELADVLVDYREDRLTFWDAVDLTGLGHENFNQLSMMLNLEDGGDDIETNWIKK